MSSSNKAALAKLCKRHYHVLPITNHRHRYLLSRCLSSVFTKISARKAKQSMAFGLLLLAGIFTTPLSAQITTGTGGICDRTTEVQLGILALIAATNDCAAVTTTQLAAITGTLDLSGGPSASISTLQAGDFAGLSALELLDLRGNALTMLPANVFDDLTNLTGLGLGGNRLTALPADVFDNLTNLIGLGLGYHEESDRSNRLTALPADVFDNLTNLTVLDLSDNNLSTLNADVFDNLGALTELYLDGNGLTALPANVFDRLTNLAELYLGSNILITLPADVFDNLTNLTELYLDVNVLSALPPGVFDNLTMLTDLGLFDSGLSALPPGVFDNLTSLTFLGLRSNNLRMLPDDIFNNLTNLAELYLGGNILITLPADVFDSLPMGALIEIDLTPIGDFEDVVLEMGDTDTIDLSEGFISRDDMGDPRDLIRFTIATDDTAIATASESGGVLTIEGVARGSTNVGILAGDGIFTARQTISVTVMGVGIVAYDMATGGNEVDAITTSEAGDMVTTYVELTSQPTGTVTVTIDGIDTTEHTLTTPASGTLTFDSTNWNTPRQLITITGVDDVVVDGDQTYSVTLTATGGDYGGVTQTVSVTNEDNDVAALTIVASGGDTTTSENLTTDSFTVALATQPSAEVTVTISDPDATEHTLTPASNTLTFGTGDWNTAQTVTLSGVNDDAVDGDQTYDLTLSASGGDYGGVTQTVSVTNTDNDNVCGRTPQVEAAILRAFLPRPACDELTAANLAAITGLNLFASRIQTLQVGDFVGLSGLTTLDLRFNNLTTLPADIFDPLTSLTGLDLSDNNLSTLPADIFDPLTSLTLLGLDSNDLKALPAGIFKNLTNLIELDLNDNNLTALPAGVFDNLTSLTLLDLDSNDLRMLPDDIFDELTNLATLDLFGNSLRALPDNIFDELTNLATLDLEGNNLRMLPDDIFDELTNLTQLDLQDNDLSMLPADVFDNLTSLTLLLLFDNNLSTLPAGIFDPVTNLTGLGLDGNNLSMLPANIFDPLPDGAIIQINLTPIGDFADVALETGDTDTIDVSGGFISRDNTGTDRTITSYTVTLVNSAIATASESGGVVTIRGVGAGSTNVTITAADGIGTATQTISVTVDAGILAYDAMTLGNPISTTTIAENDSDILYVQLASQPAGNVTLSVASSTGEGTVMPDTLTFTDTDWNTRQEVTVTAVDDNIDRDDTFTVDFAVTTGDSGAYPTTRTIPSVAVTVIDDDTAGLTVDIGDGVTTNEGSATDDTFTVVLDTQPTADVTVTISGLDTAEHTSVIPTTLTFTTTNWSAAQTVTLSSADDVDVDGDQTYDLTLTPTGGGYTGVTAPTVSVTNEDDDTAELTIADMSVNEDAGMAEVTVTLTPAVTAGPVTVEATTADGTAEAGEDYTAITRQTLTIAEGSTTQTLDIPINDDSIAEGNETFTVMLNNLVPPTGVTTVSIATDDTATVTINDDDVPGLRVDIGGGVTTSEGSATPGTFTVVLNTQPTDTVTVTISGLVAAEHSLAPSTTLTFTTANWNTAQTVTLNSVDDNVVDGDQTYDLTLTPAGGDYAGVAAQTVSVTNEDDDTAEISIADMMVNEDAGTATVTVTLSAMVTTGDVTVQATTADGTAGGTDYTAITGQTLTITAGTISQTLDITINDDNIAENDETFTVMLGTLSAPAGVTIATDATATVTITDNETAPTAITLSISQPTIPETADSTSITVTATLDGTAVLPSPTVVTVSVGESGDSAVEGTDYATVADFTLTIPAGMTSAMGTFMIDPTDDSTSDNGETVMITGTAGGFTTINPATLTIIEASISVHDAMTAGSQISTTTIVEASGTGTLYVQLASQPAASSSVTISVASSATNEGTVSTPTLTFSDTNWDTRQLITVTAVDDNVDRDDTFMVNFAVMSGDSGNYTSSLTLPSVTVTITDDDTLSDTIGLSVSPPSIAETADATTITVTATLGSAVVLPTETIVTVSVGDSSDSTSATEGTDYATIADFPLTIPALSSSGMATFMITPVDDSTSDNNETVEITGTAPGFTTVNAATLTILEAGISVFDMATGGTSTDTITIANENSGTTMFYVRLISAPASDVTLTLTSSDANEGTVMPGTLTFTATPGATSWDSRQAVTVTAVPDDIDRDDSFMVDFAVMTGDGGNYPTSLVIPSVTVAVTDDDTAGIALFDMATGTDAPSITTTEGATTDSFYVALESEPTGTVTVTISGLVAGEHTSAPPSTLTFTPTGATAWNTRQEITLTGVDDDVVDGDQMYDITLTPTGGGYDSVTAPTVSITNSDDDTATLSIADMSVAEGAGTATLTVTLSTIVTAGRVTVNAMTADGTITGTIATAGEDYTAIASQTLTFTAGSITQTLAIPINSDLVDENNETFTVTLNNLVLPTGVTTVSIADATAEVTITDDDTVSNTINLSVSPLTVAETAGRTDITVTATLGSAVVLPTATDVMVTISDGTAEAGTDYTAMPNTLTLTISTLSSSGMATFMIDPTEDTTDDNNETVTISGTATINAMTAMVNSATLRIVEAGILVFNAMGTEISTTMIAEAGSDTLHVQLASQPAGNVTLSVASSTGEGTVTPPTLTFTAGDWATRQAVTVTAVDDNIDRDDSFMVDFAVMTGDGGNYPSSLTLPSVTVTITDDDTVGIALFDAATGTDAPSITTTEGATTDSFYVALESEPTGTVTVTISGLVAGEHTSAPPSTLTFTPTGATAWNTRQEITLTGVDDNVVDGDQMYDLTLTPTGGGYDSVTAPTVSVTNEDNDTAELTIADMSVDENAGTATVTVTLSAMVTTGDVMVDLTTADGTATAGEDYTAITSQTLTFAVGETSQTLDIAISDDNIAENDETFTVMLGTLSAPAGVTIATDDTAEVTITDDETAPTAITLSINPLTVAETASATTVTVTATIDGAVVLPTATDVMVTISDGTAEAGTDYTAMPTTLTITIPALSLSATGTFMIDPTDDSTSDNNETVEITGTAPGFTTVNAATLTILEAGISVFDMASGGTSTDTITIANENSGTTMFYVRLISAPASDVTLTLTSSDANEGTVMPGTLTFTATPGATSWDSRQAVTVTAVPDDIDRDDSFMVDFAVMTGDGGNYPTSLVIPSVTVAVTDDDTAGIALFDMATGTDAPSITTTEGATTDSFYVALESEPTGTVTVTISGLVAGEHTSAPPSTLTFTPTGATAWNTRQEITLTGVDDDVVDGDQMYDITLTPTGGGYDSVTAPTVSITNSDDDTATLSIADMSVAEGAGTATLTVTLSTIVTAGRVTVNAMTADGTITGTIATAGEDYTAIASQTLTFTAGSITQTLAIPINSDLVDENNETFTVTLNNLVLPTGVTTVSIADATAEVTITDDDTVSNTINLSVSPLTVAETAGRTDITVTATLGSAVVLPTATDVMVTISDGTAEAGTDYTAMPNTLTLTISTLSSSGMATFMIDPTEDTTDDNNETVTISGTATINAMTAMVNSATLRIVEAGILVFNAMGTEISTTMIAEAGSDTLHVQLASQPAGNVTLSVASSTGEGTVTPPTLTFTAGDWATRQAVTVNAVSDQIDRGDTYTFMVNFRITDGDGVNYEAATLTLPRVTVTVTDDDMVSDMITLSVSPLTVAETAGRTDITVTATIDGTTALPTDTVVTVSVGGGTATSGTALADYTAVPDFTLTIPALSLSAMATFMIDPTEDTTTEGEETVTISGTATDFTFTSATLTIVEFSDEDQQAIEQTVVAQASGVTQVVTEQIGIRLVSRASTSSGSGGSAQDRQSLSAIDWQDRLAKFTYEGLKRLDSEADMSLDWLLQAAGGNGQLVMPLGAEALTLWATGGRISTKGDGVADYEGDVNSFILGIDTAFSNDWLAGVAVSYNDSEVDYTMNGTGETEQSLYGIHPYMSRNISQALTLWGTVGYGFGDIDFSHTSHGRATSDVTQWMAAGGLEQQIITNSPWQGAVRIKGLWGNAEVDAATYSRGATLAKVDSDFWRAHMESEMGYNFSLPGGNVRPYALIGGRWDHNDAIVSGDEWHVDVGGGVELSDNAFALNISVRTQVTDGDTEEDSIFATGSLTYDLEQDGQGLQIALSRPLNNTSPAWDSHSFSPLTDTTSGLSGAPLTSELAYGWTVRPFGLKGALQTYVQNSFDNDDRHYAVGLELAVNALTLNFESGYHTNLDSETRGTGLESMLKTKIRW